MREIIDELLENFNDLFPGRKFDFSEVEKYYDTQDFDYEVSFDEYFTFHLNRIVDLYKIQFLKTQKTISIAEHQKAFVMSVLTELIFYRDILISSENPEAKFVLERIENVIDFTEKVFEIQHGLKLQQGRAFTGEIVSSNFRGIGKLRFNLNKNEVTTLFLALIEAKILDYPASASHLSKFLENNVQYQESSSTKRINMTSCMPTISKLKSGAAEGKVILESLLVKINAQIVSGI